MITRPKFKDYYYDGCSPDKINEYYLDLEKYCDELEKRCTFQEVIRCEEIMKEDCLTIFKLEQALDKACNELDLSNTQLIELDNRFIRTTKEQWKEYLLEDDR